MPAYDPKETIKRDLANKIAKEEAKQEKRLEERLAKHRLSTEAKRTREMDKAISKVKSRSDKKQVKLISQHNKRTKLEKNRIKKAAGDNRIKNVTKIITHSDWSRFADEVFMFIVKETGATQVWTSGRVRKFRAQCLQCKKWSSAIHPGHLFAKGAHTGIRRDYRNCHHQCAGCNWKQGAGMPAQEFVDAVIAKIGQEEYDDLYANRKKTKKMTTPELIDWLEDNIPDIGEREFRDKMQKRYDKWRL